MKYILYVFLGACSYGILSTIVKLAYSNGYHLGEIVGSQMLCGTLLTWGISHFSQRRILVKKIKKNHESNVITSNNITFKDRIVLLAVGGLTVFTGLFYYGSLKYIPASLAIILLFQFTWIGVVVEAIHQRKWPNKVKQVTLIILLAGTVLAAGITKEGIASYSVWGIVLGLLSAVSYSFFIFFSSKATPQIHPIKRSGWMMTGGLMLVFLLFPPFFLFDGTIWSPLLIFGLLLGLFGAVIPTILFTIGIPHIGSGLASILGAAELPMAIICSTIVLRENINTFQWIGITLILLGIAIPELVKRVIVKKYKLTM